MNYYDDFLHFEAVRICNVKSFLPESMKKLHSVDMDAMVRRGIMSIRCDIIQQRVREWAGMHFFRYPILIRKI